MTIDRQRVSFSGNERIDIPDFRGMLDDAYDDFRHLIQLLVDDSARRLTKRYTQGTHVGLTFKVATDVRRGFYDLNQEWVVKTPDSGGSTASISLAPNSTNYIEVRVSKFTDNPQPRAFWDVDIGLTGEEFLDTINVRGRTEEAFQSNTSGFTPGAVPLFIAVTNSSVITSVLATPQDLLWEPRSLVLPSVTTRGTAYDSIGDMRSFIDFLSALVKEFKGTGQALESAPWSSFKLLREYQGMFITSSPVVTFEGTFGANQLHWSTDLKLDIAGRAGGQYTLPTATVTINDGQALYVDIPEAAPPQTLTPVVVNIGSVPIDPLAGSTPRIYVLFMRRGSTVYGAMDLAPLDSGESDTVGRDLPVALRTRIGLLTETTFQAYTSTHVIASNDTYPEALSKIDNELFAIQNNNPLEAYWIADGVATNFNISTATLSDISFTWDTDNTVVDIIVTDDGRNQTQDYTGGTGQNYRKLTTNIIQFNVPPVAGSRIKVRKEGATYGGPAAPSGGNLWSDPVDSDILPPDLAFDIGSPTNRFANGYIDTVYARNLVLSEVVGDIKPVKFKVNGDVAIITAGTVVSLFTDGKIYPAEADTSQGQHFIGIAAENIAPSMAGRVALFGQNVPGILTSLGFSPGQEIFIDNSGNFTSGSGLDNTSEYERVGWADCADGTGTGTVTDLISSYQKVDKVKPQEDYILTVMGQTVYTLPTLVVDPDNSVLDIQLWYDSGYQQLDGTGARGFRKTSSTTIELSEAPSISGKEMVFRKEGIVVAADTGGGADFANIPVEPRPTSGTAGSLDIGTLARPWSGIVLKDQTTNQVWRFSINSGVIQAVLIGTFP